MLKNNLNNLYNIKDVLFEKLLSIKSMEATKNITNTLEEVLKTCDKLKQDVDQLHNLKENYEEIRAQNNEIKDMFVDYSENNPDVILQAYRFKIFVFIKILILFFLIILLNL